MGAKGSSFDPLLPLLDELPSGCSFNFPSEEGVLHPPRPTCASNGEGSGDGDSLTVAAAARLSAAKALNSRVDGLSTLLPLLVLPSILALPTRFFIPDAWLVAIYFG
jgi:hypothetical protein